MPPGASKTVVLSSPMDNSLAGFDAERFLAEYWQRKPCLIRDGLPGFISPLDGDELAGLSTDEDVESRIVAQRDGEWEMRFGPFDDEDFAAMGDADWTLLVQAVDLWVPAVRRLRDHFSFLPPWRLDDIMVSFAAPGGGVGPHFDYYDVFLLQAEGQREWRIGQACDGSSAIVTTSGLKQLETFEETARWIVEPGDIVYIPPGIAHWGIAHTPCLTYSIGFRAPTLAEMLGDLATELMARGDDRYLTDPPLTTAMATERIDPAFVAQAAALLRSLPDDNDVLTDWFARYMTAPKYPELALDEQRRAETPDVRYEDGEALD